jgi:succinate-semialdehyde dehydrogenase/glutarate-semialdehyde dehydrogenase
LAEAGIPDGVVNVVPTTDAGAVVGTWLEDSRVRKISFTGSTGVGRLLLRQAAERIVNSSMELGGNAPFIVTADADIDAAVEGAMIAKFRNGGQACTAANRFYVHSAVIDEFTERFGIRVKELTVGAADGGAQIGPLISRRAVANVSALVDDAVRAGAHISHQASLQTGVGDGAGYFYPPTVLSGVAFDNPIVENEIFGPVAPIIEWHDDAEVIEWANASEMGLAAYVYAGNLQRAIRIAEALESGMVGVNRGVVSDPSAPFGGFKQSGLGREGARLGLEEFQETQYFSLDWPA